MSVRKPVEECLPNAGCYLARRDLPPCRSGCSLRVTMNRPSLMEMITEAARRQNKAGIAARNVLESIDGIRRIEAAR